MDELLAKIKRNRRELEILEQGLKANLPKDQHDNLKAFLNRAADLGKLNHIQKQVNDVTAGG